jgi:uncharacterized membrane protein
VIVDDKEHGLEMAMGRMLQIGVTIAALLVLIGGVIYLAQNGGSLRDYEHFHAAAPAVTTISGITASAAHLDSHGIMGLGILLLIATPVCRVIFGVVGFALLRDKLYTVISLIVLGVLLFSFFSQS